MPREKGRLSHKAEAAIVALMEEPSHEKAAQRAGVSKRTMSRWLKREDFNLRLRELREHSIRLATNRLMRASGVAVSTLIAIASNGESESNRLRAAVAILEHGWRGQEQLDVVERLSALERQQEAMHPWPV